MIPEDGETLTPAARPSAIASAPSPPRILLVEDDESLALALRVGLRRTGYQVEVAPNGSNFAELVERFRPDLALIDIALPGELNGFDLAAELRARSDAALLFVTAADTLQDRLAGFEAGADDYVVKPFALAELLARVRAVLRRSGRLVSGAVQIRDLLIDEGRRTVTRAGQPVPLTPTEFELLSTLAHAPGTAFSKAQLLSLVWGFSEYDQNLVEVHVSALRRKVERGDARLIYTERGVGYVLRP
jgi:two-component system OmpR family response regulator